MFNFLNIILNDKDIDKVTDLFQELIIDYNKIKYNTTRNESRANINDLISDKLNSISEILTNRFNIKIELKNINFSLVRIFPLVSQEGIDLKNRVMKQLDKQVVKKDLNKYISKFLYTVNHIENDLRTGIKIDTETFRFIGNNKYEFTIEMNVVKLINSKLTAREMTATILHEIGHIYDGFITLPLIVANAADITYTILGYLNESKDPKEAVFKAYKDKLGEEVKQDDLTIEIVFNLFKKYTILENKYFSGYTIGFKKENIADMLSVKFGYGDDLANALVKLTDEIKDNDEFYMLGLGVGLTLILGYLLLQFGILAIFIALSVGIVSATSVMVLVGGSIAFLVWLFSRVLGTGQIVRNNASHEDVVTRVKRIKNKIISLSNKVNNKEEAITIIKQVKSLNSLISKIDKNLTIDVGKILVNNSEYELMTIVDSLINNELHIQTLKMKYLKGD